ncbi:MAG: S49 family peptidase [Pseudomonadota bacterium]
MKIDELRTAIASGFHSRPALVYAPCADQITLAGITAESDEDGMGFVELCAAAFGMREINRDKPFLFAEGMAFIPIHGALINRYAGTGYGYTGYQFIRNQFDAAVNDPEVKGIVFDVNSYGGQVYGNFELANHIRANRDKKPSMALVDAMAFSGGYSLASAAGSMVVSPSGDVGSIGVVMMHVDQSKALKDWGVKVTMIYAGKHKVDGNPYEPLTDDVRADMQAGVDESYQEFVSLVVQNRGMSEKAVRDTEARIYGSSEAKKLGLVDAVMTPTDAITSFRSELSGSISATWRTRNMSTATPPAAEPENIASATAANTPAPASAAPAAVDAVAAERDRVAGILTCTEAKGREALAQHLALKTSMSVDDARVTLTAASPAAAPASTTSPFEAAMATGNPEIPAEGSPTGADAGKPESATNRLLAAYSKATGVKIEPPSSTKRH